MGPSAVVSRAKRSEVIVVRVMLYICEDRSFDVCR